MNYRQLLTRMIYWRIVRSWEHISACPGWMSADHWRRSDCHSRTKRQRIPPREKRPALASLHCSLARKENCFSSHLTMFSVTLSAACNQKPNFDNRLKNWDQDNKNDSFHFRVGHTRQFLLSPGHIWNSTTKMMMLTKVWGLNLNITEILFWCTSRNMSYFFHLDIKNLFRSWAFLKDHIFDTWIICLISRAIQRFNVSVHERVHMRELKNLHCGTGTTVVHVCIVRPNTWSKWPTLTQSTLVVADRECVCWISGIAGSTQLSWGSYYLRKRIGDQRSFC